MSLMDLTHRNLLNVNRLHRLDAQKQIWIMLSLSSQARIIEDLGLEKPFVYGQERKVRNCWHFSTDGDGVDLLFHSENDFKAAMNRIAVASLRFEIAILSFCLMDNHVHFVLWGTFDACDQFVRQFIRLTSHYISVHYSIRSFAEGIQVGYESIESEQYLKDAICYDLRNPTVAGARYSFYDYPWSSGSMLFRTKDRWTSPLWSFFLDKACPKEVLAYFSVKKVCQMTRREYHEFFHTWNPVPGQWILMDGVVLPDNYMPVSVIEQLFRSHKGFLFFCGRGQEKIIDGQVTRNQICLPDQELRLKRNQVSLELFGTDKIRALSARQRLELGQELRRRFYPSLKQIARMIRLPYHEVKKHLGG